MPSSPAVVQHGPRRTRLAAVLALLAVLAAVGTAIAFSAPGGADHKPTAADGGHEGGGGTESAPASEPTEPEPTEGTAASETTAQVPEPSGADPALAASSTTRGSN
jgi:hypothetical protein